MLPRSGPESPFVLLTCLCVPSLAATLITADSAGPFRHLLTKPTLLLPFRIAAPRSPAMAWLATARQLLHSRATLLLGTTQRCAPSLAICTTPPTEPAGLIILVGVTLQRVLLRTIVLFPELILALTWPLSICACIACRVRLSSISPYLFCGTEAPCVMPP